jgi:hypothetical protein
MTTDLGLSTLHAALVVLFLEVHRLEEPVYICLAEVTDMAYAAPPST